MALTKKSAKQRQGRRFLEMLILMGASILSGHAPSYAQDAAAPAARPLPPASSLNVNPKRVVFDRPGKSATITVATSTGSGAFDVELIDRVMLPDGEIRPASDATGTPELGRLKSAKPYVVVTPRRVRVAQGAAQIIRLRATPSANLAPGEYRSHLTVTGIPPADAGLTAEQAANQKAGQLSFRINSVLAISIPVIVRVGPLDVRAGIEHAALGFENISPDGKVPPVRTAMLSFDLVRLGRNSLYGDLEVRGSKKGGDPIGAVRGIGVYPEIDRRQVKVQLTRIPASGETIEIQFRDDDSAPGTVLSKASLAAP